MTKQDNDKTHHLWTGAMSVATERAGEFAVLVAESSPLASPGVVQLSFPRTVCPPEEHEHHVDFFISEETARRLAEQLIKVIDRAESLRVLHRMGSLCGTVHLRPGASPWRLHDEQTAALKSKSSPPSAFERSYDGRNLPLQDREGRALAWLELRWRETRTQQHGDELLTLDIYDATAVAHGAEWRASEVRRLLDEARAAGTQGEGAVYDAIQAQLQQAAVLTDYGERRVRFFTMDRDDRGWKLVLARGTGDAGE
ncbi:hypothetical protein G6O69_15250 [Pseudenhygromyxa sp. WMMC2535]|uniref:hypothetical protein n=1 Tax=Pseudenhygromyxa sp. WMMC2535 TaxID=2712867 RepID=UPI001595AA87|nr:hypothetical protein [Pseudenhygromyxa sp. WMMC2535]NVB39198.1 hypothetical protein [Pseudenhygromyxa sp. WMMC2535]